MNIYKISQEQNTGYATYDACIVIAPDEESAKNINPDDWTTNSGWCSSPDLVKVELIGKAVKGSSVGCILSSFNAG